MVAELLLGNVRVMCKLVALLGHRKALAPSHTSPNIRQRNEQKSKTEPLSGGDSAARLRNEDGYEPMIACRVVIGSCKSHVQAGSTFGAQEGPHA